MATTYTFKVQNFRVQNSYNDGVNPVMSDVVRELFWVLEGVTDDPTPIKAVRYGSSVLELPEYSSFIEKTSLTVGDVQGWFAALTNENDDNLLDSLKTSMDTEIALKSAPVEYEEQADTPFRDGVPV